MPTPSTRTPLRIARGTYANLNGSVADIQEGEVCYATDQDKLYVKEGSALVSTQYDISGAIGSTVQGYDADTAKTDVAQTFTAAQRGSITALTDGATITPDFAASNNFSVTLGGNRQLANPSNITVGQSGAIVITQDGTGGRALTFDSYWDFTGGTAPNNTTTASASDVLVYYVTSSTKITAQYILNVS